MLLGHHKRITHLSNISVRVSIFTSFILLLLGILWYILPPYFEEVVGNLLWVGIIISSFSVSSIFFDVVFGFVCDKLTRKLVLLLGLIMFAISLFLFSIPSFTTFLLGMIFLGISSASFNVSTISIVIDHSKKRHVGETTGFYEAMDSLGWAIGSIAGGIMLFFLPISTSLKLCFLFIVGSFFYAIHIVNDEKLTKKQVKEFLKQLNLVKLFKQELKIFQHSSLGIWSLMAFMFAFGFFESAIWMIEPMFIAENNLNFIMGGIVMSLMTLPQLVFFYLAGKMSDKVGVKKTVIMGIILLIISLIFTIKAEENLTMIAIGISAISISLSYILVPLTTLIKRDVEKTKRSEIIGDTDALYSLGGAISPLIVGIIMTTISLSLAFFASLIIFVLALIPTLVYLSKNKNPSSS